MSALAWPHAWPIILGAVIIVLVSGVLRGFTGFGFGLAASPLLSALIEPSLAVAMVLLLQIGSSLVGIGSSLREADRRSTLWLAAMAVVSTPVGVWLLGYLDVRTVRLCIAVASATGVVILAVPRRRKPAPTAGYTAPFGLIAGVLGGLCAMPGPPVLGFYLSTELSAASARSSMVLIFLATSCAALTVGLAGGQVRPEAFGLALLAAPAMVVGTLLGGELFRRAPAKLYRPVGIISLGLIALAAALRALM